MKTNILFTLVTLLFICSCARPRYLPPPDKIDVNPYGSYIEINNKSAPNVSGELITIDSAKIVVLSKKEQQCIIVPIKGVRSFSLRFAKNKRYAWTIPLGAGLPVIHGGYAIFTLPIHLIVTIAVTASGNHAFKFSDKSITYDKLRMYARFPQGLPANIDLTGIK